MNVFEWMSKKVGERKRLGVIDLNWHQSSSPWDIFSQLSTKIPKKAARIENSQCWHPRLTGACCQNLGGISINIRQMEPDWDKQSGTYSSFIVWNRAPLQDKRREGNTQLLPHLQPQTEIQSLCQPENQGSEEGREFSPLYGGQLCRQNTLPSCWPMLLLFRDWSFQKAKIGGRQGKWRKECQKHFISWEEQLPGVLQVREEQRQGSGCSFNVLP